MRKYCHFSVFFGSQFFPDNIKNYFNVFNYDLLQPQKNLLTRPSGLPSIRNHS